MLLTAFQSALFVVYTRSMIVSTNDHLFAKFLILYRGKNNVPVREQRLSQAPCLSVSKLTRNFCYKASNLTLVVVERT